MAKSRKVFIEVIVDDKGTTQKLAVDANKLEKALAGSTKKTKDADRALRGTANMSSNTTKNFSKMTQGINGGIVPAYAELAARVFAVTAAFRFLQEAADTRNLVQGQKAFGALVGTNYSAITKSLQEATAGQLKFKDAAQAAAIGTAAGLSGNQLERLAVAAKNTSFALGRDLTDSFNRLIRGVTKAEPELLDELGIILRLEPATQEYAASIGKTAKSLTAFERSQAVANFVLDEAERKFAKIAEITDKDAFAVAQFGKAFDDIINTVKIGLAEGLTPILKFLTKNITSLISVFGLLALPLIKSVLPNLDNFTKGADAAGAAAEKMATKAQSKFDGLSKQTRILGKTMDDVTKSADDLSKGAGVGTGQKTGTGLAFLSGDDKGKGAQNQAKRILDGAQKQMDRDGKITTGKLKAYNKQQLADLQLSYQQRAAVVKKFETKTRLSFKGIGLTAKQTAAGIQVAFTKAFASISRGATLAAKGVDKAFKAAGILGLILLFVDLGKMAFDALFPMSDAAKKAKDEIEELSTKTEELARHLSDVNELANSGDIFLNTTESIQQLGNAVKGANVVQLIRDIKGLDELGAKVGKNSDEFINLKKGLTDVVTELAKMDTAFTPLIAALDDSSILEEAVTEKITKRAAEMIGASDAANQLADAQKALNQEINSLLGSIPKAPLQGLISAFDREFDLRVILQAETDKNALNRELAKIDERIRQSQNVKSGTKEVPGKPYKGLQMGNTTLTTRSTVIPDRTKEDIAATEKLQKERAQLIANAAKGSTIIEKDKETRADLVELATEQLDREEKILESKNAVARIDMISQSFDAQRERAIISVAQANERVLAAKNAELSAQGAFLSLKKKGSTASKEEIANAGRAKELAKEATLVAQGQLQQANRAYQLELLTIRIAERRLSIAREINRTENEIQRAKIARERGSTPGAGTVGKSLGDIGRNTQVSEETELTKQLGVVQNRIAEKSLGYAKLFRTSNIQGIADLDQELETLRLQGEQLSRNLEIKRNFVLQDMEIGRLQGLQNEKTLAAFSLSPAREAAQRRILDLEEKGGKLSDKQKRNIHAQTEALTEQEIMIKGLQNIRNTVQGSMESAFMSLVDGSKSAKEAFSDMARSILASIAQMIIKMLVFKAIQAATGFFGGPAGRNGAITEEVPGARMGGILQGYSTGGIARGRQAGYPAILHGTEAVVPLPNKKEIPVDIRGGTGNVNNININIASDGTTKESGDQGNNAAARLGKVVSVAIQEELQKQKRPGGILSPYGAAS